MSDSQVPGQLVEVIEPWEGAESNVSEYPDMCCAVRSVFVMEEKAHSLFFDCPTTKKSGLDGSGSKRTGKRVNPTIQAI